MKNLDYFDGSVIDDPKFNSFFEKYANNFVRVVGGEHNNELLYISWIHYYKPDVIYVHACSLEYKEDDRSKLLSAKWNFNNKRLRFDYNIVEENTDVTLEIISRDEFVKHVDDWIVLVEKNMTDIKQT